MVPCSPSSTYHTGGSREQRASGNRVRSISGLRTDKKEFRQGKQYKSDARAAQAFNGEKKCLVVTGEMGVNIIITVSSSLRIKKQGDHWSMNERKLRTGRTDAFESTQWREGKKQTAGVHCDSL